MAVIGAGARIGGLTGSGAVSRLLVVVSGDTSGLSRALGGAEKSIAGFNASASKIGGALTRTLTLPLLALGGVSLKLASDYNAAIARVEGLTSVLDDGQHTIENVSDDLLALSQIVPTSPVDLANSLYYAGSAGLSFGKAMDVVELSAKGAAIGMGDASDISKVLIFALNAFEGTGLTAAHAMDVLTAAIKYGTAEPEDMAIALGRLLPVARDAGLTFDDVAASVAALTNIGLPTRVATTSLRALFTELLAPTIAATERLNQFGISAQQLRNTLRLGPIAAFKLLEESVGQNQDALHDIIPQIRGFTAFTGLSGKALKTYQETIDHVHDSVGTLDKAFSIISKTPAVQFQLALNKLRVAGIRFGQTMIPVFLKVMQVVGDFGDLLTSMPGWTRVGVVAVGLLAAALGPLLKLYGNLINSGKGLFTSFQSTAIGLTTMAIAAGVAIGGFSSLADGSDTLIATLSTGIGTVVAVTLALGALSRIANAGALGVNALSVGLASMSGGTIAAIALAIGAVVVTIGKLIGRAHEGGTAVKDLRDAFVSAGQGAKTFKDLIDQVLDTTKASAEVQSLIEDAAKWAQVIGKTKTPLTGLHAVVKTLASSAAGLGAELGAQFNELSASSKGVLTFTDSMGKGISALLNFNDAIQAGETANLGQMLKDQGTSMDQFIGDLRTMEDVAKSADPDFAKLVGSLINMTEAAAGAGDGFNRLQLITEAQLANFQATQVSTKKLAEHFGVDIGFMQEQLDKYHVTSQQVFGGGQKTMNAFGQAAFGALGKAAARAIQAEEALNELNQTLTETMSGNLGLFDAFDKKIKKSTESIVRHAEAAASAALRQAENAQTLISRGVPADLVNELIAAGPQMVAKFVNATPKQLDRLVTAYQIRLGAIDAAIVKEGEHQKGKGKDMVSGFVQSILSLRGITNQAGHQIVNEVVKGLQSGKIKPEALDMIRDFVTTVEASGLPKQAASKIAADVVSGITQGKGGANVAGVRFVQAFSAAINAHKNLPKVASRQVVQSAIRELAQAKGVLPSGKKNIEKFAQGIAQGKGLSKAQANHIVEAVKQALKQGQQPAHQAGKATGDKFKDGLASRQAIVRAWGAKLSAAAANRMREGTGAARSAGASVGQAYADGLRSKAGAAEEAGRAVAAAGKRGLTEGSKGSPKYFSYYLARDIVDQYHQGMKEGGLRFHNGQVNVRSDTRRRSSGQPRYVIIQGDVAVDGMDSRMRIVAREETTAEMSYRGL